MLYLAPLRRCDVADAASWLGISEPDSFVDEIVRCGVVPLATNPITLRFLIEAYRQTGAFPSRRRDLFLQGLRELCRDPRDQIRRSPEESQLRAEQTLSIAGRIAAVCILSNRIAVGQESNETSVAVSDLAGGTERVGNCETPVAAESVTAVLKSALFVRGGRWAHRTYCEFLAAWYISRHNVPTQTALSLLLHPLDPTGHVAPQLHETERGSRLFQTQFLITS